MDEKVRQGWPTGLAPYGYVNVDDRNEPVVPHPEKSKTVMRIFELYASGQHTFKSLADKLAAEGHTYRPSQPRFNRSSLSYRPSSGSGGSSVFRTRPRPAGTARRSWRHLTT